MVSGRSRSRSRAKKSVPPSRVRYEKANPAVTVRVSRELRDALAELKEEQGLSMGDLLRIGLEKAKPDLDDVFQRGLEEGYDTAKDEYEVTYWCSRCRSSHMSLTNQQSKEAAAKLMYVAGWHRTACR